MMCTCAYGDPAHMMYAPVGLCVVGSPLVFGRAKTTFGPESRRICETRLKLSARFFGLIGERKKGRRLGPACKSKLVAGVRFELTTFGL